MNNSLTPTPECLQDALFTAAHSYSASVYEAAADHILDDMCDDFAPALSAQPEMSAYAFA